MYLLRKVIETSIAKFLNNLGFVIEMTSQPEIMYLLRKGIEISIAKFLNNLGCFTSSFSQNRNNLTLKLKIFNFQVTVIRSDDVISD